MRPKRSCLVGFTMTKLLFFFKDGGWDSQLFIVGAFAAVYSWEPAV